MRAVIATDDAVLTGRTRQALLGLGLECTAGDCVSLAGLVSRLGQRPADLVVVGVEPASAGLATLQTATTQTAAPLLALGSVLNPQLILDALRSGARLYLDQGQLREELLAALDNLHQAGTVTRRLGRALAVTAASAGSGVTTVAASLAFALVESQVGEVVLAELGGGVPELALNLDLHPRHSVADLAALWEQMDATMVRQTVVTHPVGLHILLHPPETLQAHSPEPSAMRQTVGLLRSMFAYTVLDLGYQVAPAPQAALALADTILVVLRLTVPSLRLTRQLVRQLVERGVERDKFFLVANRHNQQQQVDRKKAQEVVGLPIQEWVPDDPATLNQALNHGQPLVRSARRAAITRTFDSLAGRLHRGRPTTPNGKVA